MDLLDDNALDFISNAPDGEFMKFLEESGDDVAELDRKGQAAFGVAIKKHGDAKRGALRQQAAQRKAALAQRSVEVPTDRLDLLALAKQLQARGAAIGRAVSLQHRELKDLPDEELRGFVAELVALQTSDPTKE